MIYLYMSLREIWENIQVDGGLYIFSTSRNKLIIIALVSNQVMNLNANADQPRIISDVSAPDVQTVSKVILDKLSNR